MTKKYIEYRSGYKYQLAVEYRLQTGIIPKNAIEEPQYVKLLADGTLVVTEGYAWDGPSGPVIDTRQNLRASLVHDAFYQLMRLRKLTIRGYKDRADRLFKSICIEDGVPKTTAHIYYLGLKLGGKPATDPKSERIVKRAPR